MTPTKKLDAFMAKLSNHDDPYQNWIDNRETELVLSGASKLDAQRHALEEAAIYAPRTVEEDGDEVFTPIDVCIKWECQTWEPGAKKPTHPKLVKRARLGRLWWTCPTCNGSYGDAGPAHST